jgi:hypothetical protein
VGKIFRTSPDRPWGPPSLKYQVTFPQVRRPGRGVNHPPTSSAEVKERVEPYLYSPSGASWPVLVLLLLTRIMHSVSCIVSQSMAALSHRQPASTGPFSDCYELRDPIKGTPLSQSVRVSMLGGWGGGEGLFV